MQSVLPVTAPLPLFDIHTSRHIEQAALATTLPHTLMRRAGLAVAQLALAVAPHAQRVWIAVGPGNNGGDGLEAALHLHRAGKQVGVRFHGAASALPDDARAALARAQAGGVPLGDDSGEGLEPGDLAIDALLGLGATRAPAGEIALTIERLNRLRCAVLAIDLPSGLHAETGQPLGAACVVASHTLALLTLKPGLFTATGRDHAGRIWLDPLGTDLTPHAPQAWLVGHVAAGGPRHHAQHKGSFGDVAVVGGAPGMAGAALLAARAAHAAGAGRVYVDRLGSDDANGAFDQARPELMCRSGWWRSDPAVLAASTVVCGCGGGDAIREPLPRLLARAARLVLDADALNAVAADPMLQAALRQRAERGAATVLTPHPLEAARLLGRSTAQVQADRWQASAELVQRFQCVIVLKGSGSIVAAPGQVPRVNGSGNAALASAGTGDVLAGWLGGTWAQAAPQRGSDAAAFDVAFGAAVSAVSAHGAAADPARPGPMRAGDLIETLHQRLRAGR